MKATVTLPNGKTEVCGNVKWLTDWSGDVATILSDTRNLRTQTVAQGTDVKGPQ